MGLVQSHRNSRSPESDQATNNIYKYPPKAGNYFGSHFYMGGEKFETMRPDMFLFGENEDLNFLANKPFSFSFSAPQLNEPIKTLKSLINIRKDSLKFVKVSDENTTETSVNDNAANQNNQSTTNQSTTNQSSTNQSSTNQSTNQSTTTTPSPPITSRTTTATAHSDANSATTITTTLASVPPPPPLSLIELTPFPENITIATTLATTIATTLATTTTTNTMANNIATQQQQQPAVQQQQQQQTTTYNIEFTFDSDVKCAITIYYFATEDFMDKQVVYKPKDPQMNSETFHYKRGSNQVFSQTTHIIDPSKFPDSQWQYDHTKEVIPIVIQCDAEDEEHIGHSHILYAIVDKIFDGSFVLKPLKQKQMINGLCYLLQEIYGIENKNTESTKPDEDIDDNGSECIICMCEPRDTVILPCRHLCLCNGCADNLRYQANNCPICRAKFRALLQIRAIQKKKATSTAAIGQSGRGGGASGRQQRELSLGDTMATTTTNQDGVPPGYEAVSLVEALNGPTLPHRARQVATSFHRDQGSQSIYVNIDGVVAGGGGGGGGGGGKKEANNPKTQQQHQQQQQQQHKKFPNKRATLATVEPDFATTSTTTSTTSSTTTSTTTTTTSIAKTTTTSSSSSTSSSVTTSRNTISPSLSTVGERYDGDDDEDEEDGGGGDGDSQLKSNQDDMTSSSAHVVNSLTEDGAGTGGDGSSCCQQMSIRSSVANTSMDSETAADIKFIDSQVEGCSTNSQRNMVTGTDPLSSNHINVDLECCSPPHVNNNNGIAHDTDTSAVVTDDNDDLVFKMV